MTLRDWILPGMVGVAGLWVYSLCGPQPTQAAMRPQADSYAARLSDYQARFHPGTTRATVRATLNALNVAMENPDMVIPASGEGDLLVRLGEHSSSVWYCRTASVYIDMRFESSANGQTLDPKSPLKRIDLEQQNEDCL